MISHSSLCAPTPYPSIQPALAPMGRKGKNKAPKRPDPDTVYLFIENPFGVGAGADLGKGSLPLVALSNWIHRMFPRTPDALPAPSMVWSRPKQPGLILPVHVPANDHEKVKHLLGVHDWETFVNPGAITLQFMGHPTAVGVRSKIYLCSLNNEDDIVTRGMHPRRKRDVAV